MDRRPYPSAFMVPIWVLSSSTIRVMVVADTSMAISRKKTGKTPAIPSMIDVSLRKLT